MKKIILISLFVLVSCSKDKGVTTESVKTPFDFTTNTNSASAEDDFSDLKKLDDEACDTEEEIKEKLVKPKQEAFKLQGGDTGCDIEGLNKKD